MTKVNDKEIFRILVDNMVSLITDIDNNVLTMVDVRKELCAMVNFVPEE